MLRDINLTLGVSKSLKNIFKLIKRDIQYQSEVIKNTENKWRAVFLPYKASMWTSLESIWKAANRDPNCDNYVVPIPYYNISNKW